MSDRGISEQSLHLTVARYLELALPADAVWWHTANQRKTPNPYQGARLKQMGVKAGIPDIMIYHDRRLFCIELKASKGRLSPAQTVMLGRLRTAGARVNVCYSLEEVSAFLGQLIPLKARAA